MKEEEPGHEVTAVYAGYSSQQRRSMLKEINVLLCCSWLIIVRAVSFYINESQTFLNLFETIFVNKGFAACSRMKCGRRADRSAKCQQAQTITQREARVRVRQVQVRKRNPFQGVTEQRGVPEPDAPLF